jgi:hypothetical protein
VCVAVDDQGNVVTSSNPTGGAGAWSVTNVLVSTPLTSVSCPSVSLCVGVGGGIVTSTNPTGGEKAWTPALSPDNNLLTGVSCPSPNLCVAVDNRGNVVTSTDPTAGTNAWTTTDVDGTNYLQAISCPSAELCVAVDYQGNVVTSTNPTGTSAAWSTANIASVPLNGVSCASPSLCVAVDYIRGQAQALISTNPGGAAPWAPTDVDTQDLLAISCAPTSLCVAVGSVGQAVVGVLRTTSTTLSCTPTSVTVDSGSTCAATVTDATGGTASTPTGTVSFSSDSSGSFSNSSSCMLSAGSCRVTYIPTAVGSGSHKITASYGGDGTHLASSDNNTLTVVKRATRTNLACATGSVSVAKPATCTATVSDTDGGTASTPTGTVRFASDGTGVISGGGACALAAGACQVTYTPTAVGSGTHQITASYSGDASHAASQGKLALSVSAAATIPPPTLTVFSSKVSGQTVFVGVACAASPCSGDAVLRVRETLHAGKLIALESRQRAVGVSHQSVVIGAQAFTLPAGQTRNLSVPLNPIGRQLLKRFGTLPVMLIVTQSAVTNATTTIKRLTITQHKNHPKKHSIRATL